MAIMLCTKTEYARAIGVDARSLRNLPKPVDHLVSGRNLVPLYLYLTAGISAAVAVNSGVKHPLRESQPKL